MKKCKLTIPPGQEWIVLIDDEEALANPGEIFLTFIKPCNDKTCFNEISGWINSYWPGYIFSKRKEGVPYKRDVAKNVQLEDYETENKNKIVFNNAYFNNAHKFSLDKPMLIVYDYYIYM